MELESRRREALVRNTVPSWEAGEILRLLPLSRLIISSQWEALSEARSLLTWDPGNSKVSLSPPTQAEDRRMDWKAEGTKNRQDLLYGLFKNAEGLADHFCRFWSWHLNLVYQKRPGQCGEYQVSDRTCPTENHTTEWWLRVPVSCGLADPPVLLIIPNSWIDLFLLHQPSL